MYFFPLGTFLGSAGNPLSGDGELAGRGGRTFGVWVWEKENPGPTRQLQEEIPVLRPAFPGGAGNGMAVLATPSVSYAFGQMA